MKQTVMQSDTERERQSEGESNRARDRVIHVESKARESAREGPGGEGSAGRVPG
jgi:hypothetical protein